MALTDNIVAYYKLDESSGTNANDEVAAYDLTTVDTPGWVSGKINNCLDFTPNDYAENTSFDQGAWTEYSWSFWVYLDITTDLVLLTVGEDASFGYRSIQLTSGAFKVNTGSGAAIISSPTSAASSGQWYFIVGTAKVGDKVRLYVDGTEVGTGTAISAFGNPNNRFLVGVNYGVSGEYLNGKMDEIGVWSRALSSSEVTELYNGGTGLSYPFSVSVTVTPAALTLSTTAQAPTTVVLISPSTLAITGALPSAFVKVYAMSHIEVGTGGRRTRFISKIYPNSDGLTAATTSQTGHKEDLIAVKGSLVPLRAKRGIN